jgi:hypothetical protein
LFYEKDHHLLENIFIKQTAVIIKANTYRTPRFLVENIFGKNWDVVALSHDLVLQAVVQDSIPYLVTVSTQTLMKASLASCKLEFRVRSTAIFASRPTMHC